MLTKKPFLIVLLICLFLSACSTTQMEQVSQIKNQSAASKVVVYAPASSSSIPVILATSKMQDVELVLYTNQSQANTIFLRGEASILVTGVSVGFDMQKNGAPVQMIDTYVTGLSYLVTRGFTARSFSDLKGRRVYVPFEGSPIEEAAAFLAGKEDLVWGTDITPVYSAFDASIALLKQGKLDAVILPEPMVSLVEGQPNVEVAFSMFDLWNQKTGSSQGYPQVGSFVNSEWAKLNPKAVDAFNKALAQAIKETAADPVKAADAVKGQFKIPTPKLISALGRTHYMLLTGLEMKKSVSEYYSLIGKSIDGKLDGFFYIP